MWIAKVEDTFIEIAQGLVANRFVIDEEAICLTVTLQTTMKTAVRGPRTTGIILGPSRFRGAKGIAR